MPLDGVWNILILTEHLINECAVDKIVLQHRYKTCFAVADLLLCNKKAQVSLNGV